MISKSNVFEKHCDRCDNAFVVIFFKIMYNKTIIRFGFCDIRNNQGLRLVTLTSTLIIPDITKISSDNCLKFATFSLPSLLSFLKF